MTRLSKKFRSTFVPGHYGNQQSEQARQSKINVCQGVGFFSVYKIPRNRVSMHVIVLIALIAVYEPQGADLAVIFAAFMRYMKEISAGKKVADNSLEPLRPKSP